MEHSSRVFHVKQEVTDKDWLVFSSLGQNDFCFFRFVGGNESDTERLAEQLYRLKSTGVCLAGVFRFPFRFEGKKRLQTAVLQYHWMRQLCDAVTYLHSDGMMHMLDSGTSIQAANRAFDAVEQVPVRAIEEMLYVTGDMNIDVNDVQTFLKAVKGPVYVRSFEGDTFDEPLKYILSEPYLPQDYTEGQQLMVNIGYCRDVDMMSFQNMNLRLTDLFHKAELFKLGTYLIDEPGNRFKVTLMVNGLVDPFPRPQNMQKMYLKGLWLKKYFGAGILKRRAEAIDASPVIVPFSRTDTSQLSSPLHQRKL